MADIEQRAKHEEDLAKTLAEILKRYEPQWMNGEQSPNMVNDLTDHLAPLLVILFASGAVGAARELLVDVASTAASRIWGVSYGAALANYITGRVADLNPITGPAAVGITQPDWMNDPAYHQANWVKKRLAYASEEAWNTLAATEVTRAHTAGGEFSAARFREQTGRVAIAIWMCEPNPCPVCLPLDGERREIWEQFFPLGPPTPHPNCRCWLKYFDPVAFARVPFTGGRPQRPPLSARQKPTQRNPTHEVLPVTAPEV